MRTKFAVLSPVVALALCVISLAGAGPATMPPASAPATSAASAGGREAFIKSLALRMDRIIADSTHPGFVWLTQTAPVAYRPAASVTMALTLEDGTTEHTKLRALGSTAEISPRDLGQKPFGMSTELNGLPDGNYRIAVEVREGGNVIATFEQPIWLVKGIDARQADVVARLAKIQGHEGTKASVLYPYDVARAVNAGQRGYNEADLGINETKQVNYLNFAAEMQRSEELLAALEGGKDLLWQAKGDMKRHYFFAEGNEIMPYRVFVPPTWDGKTPLPMVFVLHGNTRNQDFYFERNEQIIPKLAEKHGFMMVGVFGYHPNGGYNLSSMPGAGRGGRGGATTFGPAAAAPAGRGVPPSNFMNGMSPARLTELSEIDTMHVYDLVKKEYPIDPKQTYLFGYSAGGNGGYYIGGKYAANWAAIAIGGAGTSLAAAYPYYDTLKSFNTPFFIYYGEKDTVQAGSAATLQSLTAHGISAQMKSYPGVDHDGGPAAGAADAFDFFAAHPRK